MTLIYESVNEKNNADLVGARNGLTPPTGAPPEGLMTMAFIEGGRWLARCPLCPSARWTNPDWPYWCPDCGAYALVDWPKPEQQVELDDVLAVRPMVNRNWSPFAPVAGRPGIIGERIIGELCVENLERGYPVPQRLQAKVEQFLADDWAERGLTEEMAGWNVEAG